MILLYFIHLCLMLLFSLASLTLVVTLSFKERGRTIVGLVLSAVIFLATLSLTHQAFAFRRNGEEFSKLIEQASLFFQRRNR